MTNNNSKFTLTHECFERAIEAINAATTIEGLLESITTTLSIRMSCYHHFAAVGSFGYKSLSQYYAYKMPQLILDHLESNRLHKADPGVTACFAKGQPIWLSDMPKDPIVIKGQQDKLAAKMVALTGDGLCIPLYGPNNRYGYMFIGFGRGKEDCKSIATFQIQALAQQLHVRYCLMLEQMHKQVKLTQREAEVLELLTFGKTNTDIGEVLNISSNTVAGYVKQIFLKLEVSDRVSAAMRAQTIKVII